MKRLYYFFSSFVLILCLMNCVSSTQKEQVENKPSYTKLKGKIFGTTYYIVYKDTVNYQKEFDSIFSLFNNSLSTYTPNSIISKVNQGDSTVVVDAYFIEAFEKAQKIYKDTEGYFDPTIGKLINAYGFGSGETIKNLSENEIQTLLDSKGFEKVTLKENKVLKPENIEFNVNAFAKGLGIDVIGRFIEKQQIKDYLVEIGGEIRARGKNSENVFWRLGIDDPNTDQTRSYSRVISLKNQSMATSGNYRKFRLNEKGEKIVHTVNPKTGMAQESNLLSVSVLKEGDCADVDAYATAFLAMGLEKTKSFLTTHPELKVVLLFSNDKGEIEEYSNR
ncbi:FAD:protein FMN transferase [Tenacibaculum sp. M341]|nr:FAD:protein FMN transferase [Tenacibaculum sp. M341]